MRQLFGRAGFALELRESPARALGPHDVLVGVFACGVCGTDLHFLRDAQDWTPLGHEIAGEVLEVGSHAQRVKPGDRVIVEDVSLCGACEACKSGQIELCRSGHTLGGQAGMADLLVVHENMLNVYSGIDEAVAAMVEPLAVAIRCVDKLRLARNSSLVIYGLGPIGLLCAAYAKCCGARHIAMVGRNPGRQRTAAQQRAALALGADEVGYADAPDSAEFDAAIVAASPSLCADALKRVRYGGSVLAAGITLGAGALAQIDVNDMVMNKKSLLTSIAEPAQQFPLAIRLIQDGAVDAGRIVTHTLRLSEADKLRTLYESDSPAIKTVMLP